MPLFERLPSQSPATPAEAEPKTATKKARELSIGSQIIYGGEPRTIENILSAGSDRVIVLSKTESFPASPDEDIDVPA